MVYYEIDEKIARVAHEMKSMSDYKLNSATAGYRAAVDEASSLVESKKREVSPYYHDKLDALLHTYAYKLAQWTNAYNRNAASCPSVMICGPANFPVRKKNKQNAREDALWKEYETIKGILEKIKSIGSGPVDLADPHAREILTDKLNKLQNELESEKAMNAHYRKHKTMKGFPNISDQCAESFDQAILDSPPFAQTPFPSFQLTSLRGKIKRVQARLDELDKRASEQGQPEENIKFDGGEIVRNLEADRLQILFDEKPDEATRAKLKQNGFRWSPTNSAWQRKLTPNAEIAARRVFEK